MSGFAFHPCMRHGWLLVLAAACGRIDFEPRSDGSVGPGDVAGGSDAGGGGDAGGAGLACMGGTPSCAPTSTVVSPGNTFTSGNTTVSSGNGMSGSCGGASANEYAVQVRALVGATYTFTTAGTQFDSVLYLRDGCSGAELACVNNPGTTESITMPLTPGQIVIAVVDGVDRCGTVQLRITGM